MSVRRKKMSTTRNPWVPATLVAAALALLGCAATKPPTAKLSTAEVAVKKAEESDAGQHAPLELRVAREKLDKARRAMDDEEYDRARRLADEAFVDAQLAEARARSAKAKQAASAVRKSVEALRSEAARPPAEP
jgi:hypothetical protein